MLDPEISPKEKLPSISKNLVIARACVADIVEIVVLAPPRTHFCEVVAARIGRFSTPVKYFLELHHTALVNISAGRCAATSGDRRHISFWAVYGEEFLKDVDLISLTNTRSCLVQVAKCPEVPPMVNFSA